MEGPIPVSALIHAATLVTAGVFLIFRCSMLLEFTPLLLCFLTFIGSHTAFLAASAALCQNDIKKIIALSTCSQLGYMVFSCGASLYSQSFFHLIDHAFFKALLFLSAGSVIAVARNEQDIRKMGAFVSYLPMTSVSMILSSLSLSGVPFLTGYYSKDLIIEMSAGQYNVLGYISF